MDAAGIVLTAAVLLALGRNHLPSWAVLAGVPILWALCLGLPPAQVLEGVQQGVKQAGRSALLLAAASFFCTVLLQSGMFHCLAEKITLWLSASALRLMLGTVLISTGMTALCSIIAAYLVTISVLLPAYRQRKLDVRILGLLTAAASTAGQAVPWNGRFAQLAALSGVDAQELWRRALPLFPVALGLCLLLAAACAAQSKAKERCAAAREERAVAAGQSAFSGKFRIDLGLLIGGSILLTATSFSAAAVFFLLGCAALAVNCRTRSFAMAVARHMGRVVLPVCLTCLAGGVMVGVMRQGGMLEQAAERIASAVPPEAIRWLPWILSALSCVFLQAAPYQCLFLMLPVLLPLCAGAGLDAVDAVLPFVFLFPCAGASAASATQAIDRLLEQPRSTHARFSFVPLTLLQCALLAVTAGYLA